jgi:Domain of unknown function (DUF4160)
MPTISMFYGLLVSMYFMDTQEHNSPHIHVRYQNFRAVFGIPDGNMLAGELPPKKQKLIAAWSEIHGEELMANWFLAVEGKELFRIDPLK